MTLKKVLIFGGTHGNEWTGIQIVKQYASSFKEKFPQLDIEFILANPEAYKANRRFVNEDLNRAFQFLHEERKNSFEHQRARELKQLIDQGPCYVIDLHTTTANMGKTVILSEVNQLNLSLCQKLSEKFSDCRIIVSPDPQKKYLASQSSHSMMIEVGPVPNSVVSGPILEASLLMLEFILMTLNSSDIAKSGSLEVFEEAEDVYYPLTAKDEINAYIHSSFQGKDFTELTGEYAAFETFGGETIIKKHGEVLYPIFVNEAAYYPQKLAYSLCRKRRISF
jgi:aspartoacylase